MPFVVGATIVALAALGAVAKGQEAPKQALLPPLAPWAGGSSEALVAAPDDPWITPAERAGFRTTPSHAETLAWIDRLVAASDRVRRIDLGRSPEGRELVLVVVSKEGAATPAELAANRRPTLLAQAGIHSGEIDGKDAGLMLLRDLTVGGSLAPLLDRANLLFLPIFNVDGHERASAFSRINQRGPENAGWRTTSANLNLNRDYTKLDTPEMRLLIEALNDWSPDLYFDLHVTDGADYQYDVTFGWNGPWAYSPAIAAWLDGHLKSALDADLAAAGHVPGPFVNYRDFEGREPDQGLIEWSAGPRYSNGYGDLRHLPTVLVENHSLKPYRQRVLGTRVLLETVLRTLGERGDELRDAVARDRARRRDPVPLAWKTPEAPPEGEGPAGTPHLHQEGELQDGGSTFDLAAIASRIERSEISGDLEVRWLGEPETRTLPYVRMSEPAATAARPAAYWIPPAHAEVIERLRRHGIAMVILEAPRELEVELYRFAEPEVEAEPFEGRIRVKADATLERHRMTFAPGTARVPTDQPLGDLAVLLLEPASPDSFFQWGFFLACLQRTEYAEAYVMEPMARAMMDENPALRAEFDAKLAADPEFAADRLARLDWFYRRTPFHDARERLYPVAREP